MCGRLACCQHCTDSSGSRRILWGYCNLNATLGTSLFTFQSNLALITSIYGSLGWSKCQPNRPCFCVEILKMFFGAWPILRSTLAQNGRAMMFSSFEVVTVLFDPDGSILIHSFFLFFAQASTCRYSGCYLDVFSWDWLFSTRDWFVRLNSHVHVLPESFYQTTLSGSRTWSRN